MASYSSSLSIFGDEDHNLVCMHKIYIKVGSSIFHYIVEKVTADKPEDMSLIDYCASKGIPLNKCKETSFFQRTENEDVDPWSMPFDVSVLIKCIWKVNHGLASKDRYKWKEGTSILEILILGVKSKRSDLDDKPTLTNQQLIDKIRELRKNLCDIIRIAGGIYEINMTEIEFEIISLDLLINNVLQNNFSRKDYEEYMENAFLPIKSLLSIKDGEKDVRVKKKIARFTVFHANHIADIDFCLHDIFTDMELVDRSLPFLRMTFEDILKDNCRNGINFVVVIEGTAGIGKTTLIKKIMCDWHHPSPECIERHLLSFDLLLKVDCRNTALKSFAELLQHLMPKISKNLKGDDLKQITLRQKILVILDGIDEMNKSSSLLFEELLQLKKAFDIMLIVTARPEKIAYFKQRVKSLRIKAKYFHLLGVCMEKRDELVSKYHCAIAKKYKPVEAVEGLLTHLKATQYHLGDLWKVPYNLALVTLIWAFDSSKVMNIKTASELHIEVYNLYSSKLTERLERLIVLYGTDEPKDDADKVKVIDHFLYCVAKEAMIGLKNDDFYLSCEAYGRIMESCSHLKTPIEDLVSSFLKKIPGSRNIYAFPHRGFQDYLAAQYIWLKITGKYLNYDVKDIMKSVGDILTSNNVPTPVSQSILKVTKNQLDTKPQKNAHRKGKSEPSSGAIRKIIPNNASSTMIRNIIDEMHGTPSRSDILRFQNMLVSLVGMFYTKKEVVEGKIKLEALTLLVEAGMKDRDAWISLLNAVNCDEYVASFICKQPKILEGDIQITDSTFHAYISLMQSLTTPLKEPHKVKIILDIMGDLSEGEKLLKLIYAHQFKLMLIQVNENNFQQYTSLLKELQTPLKVVHDLNVAIDIKKTMPNISELIKQLKEKNCKVSSMRVKDAIIRDSEIGLCTDVLISLAWFQNVVHEWRIAIAIQEKTSDVCELLHAMLHLHKKKFVVHVDIYHHYDFRNPRTHTYLEDALNHFFSSFKPSSYMGSMTPNLKLPRSVTALSLSVADIDSYLNLQGFLQTKPPLKYLVACVKRDLDPSIMTPFTVPDDWCGVYLRIPDIIMTSEISNAVRIIKKLQPAGKDARYSAILFPRFTLRLDGIKFLLQYMNGIRTSSVVFPHTCEPPSTKEAKEIQEFAKTALDCEYGISWKDFDDPSTGDLI